ncbi:4-(cytidine 5'-diphospho)-2-C-methyl-D-erythritol kinase, partial [Devosia sp.]|uniref:4-(cytidine 5'-diphospho)-2-C-methyl-D-erythritol kinase n=1 Tax=Devosia sp. TaxID=1871048 RepID=UPI002AFFDE56
MAEEIATEFAPAKVNLALHVTGRRADGYHELESLIVFAGLADAVDASPAEADSLVITGPFAAGLGAGPGNLVLRAVAGFRQRWPDAVEAGLKLRLTKNLPVAAGIGGGSADAAAALRLMARLSSRPVALDDLTNLAAGLGADVPACLLGVPLLARGIGERLMPLPVFPAAHIVLVNPMVPLA